MRDGIAIAASPAATAPVPSVLLTVMTFNTANDLVDAAHLIDLIGQVQAGIVGLVELGPRNATALEHALQAAYPSRVLDGTYIHGKGLLSRYPIREYDRFTLASGRPYLVATLVVETQQVTIAIAHPPPPLTRRWAELQIRDITLLLQRVVLDRPTVLLGDFNCVARSRSYCLLVQAGLIDTHRAVGTGRGLTCPTRYQYAPIPLPRLMRIDYIWVTPHFVPISSYVGTHVGSDHLPVISELALGVP